VCPTIPMIIYTKGGVNHFLNVFRVSGSVFPRIFPQTLLCASIASAVKYLLNQGYLIFLQEKGKIMLDNAMWTGFTFLVGFLVVFRTSQAYARFQEGCSAIFRMRAEWMDACSCLIAFCKMSRADARKIARFQNTLIRLFSMLHATALAEIEDSNSKVLQEICAFRYELVDATGIDEESLLAIRQSEAKVELIFQWIQQLIIENIPHVDFNSDGVLNIPPPILSRSFQEVANGMVAFNDAIKVSSIPFPFPYAQTCDCLLLMHFMLTPLVVSQWFYSAWWAGTFTFITVFILWVLNSIAVEIENPFGSDANDVDCQRMQIEFNSQLVQLLSKRQLRTPFLSDQVEWLGEEPKDSGGRRKLSFLDAWSTMGLDMQDVGVVRSIRSNSNNGSIMPKVVRNTLGAWGRRTLTRFRPSGASSRDSGSSVASSVSAKSSVAPTDRQSHFHTASLVASADLEGSPAVVCSSDQGAVGDPFGPASCCVSLSPRQSSGGRGGEESTGSMRSPRAQPVRLSPKVGLSSYRAPSRLSGESDLEEPGPPDMPEEARVRPLKLDRKLSGSSGAASPTSPTSPTWRAETSNGTGVVSISYPICNFGVSDTERSLTSSRRHPGSTFPEGAVV